MTRLRHIPGGKTVSCFGYTTAASIFLLILSITPSYAIPSPELVVGSLSSVSQLIAIASAIIGGGAAVAGARTSANSAGANRSARIAWRIFGVAGLVLALSLAANFYQYSKQRSERLARLESALIRPTEMTDGRTLDPDLKEISYNDQLHAARGISTDAVEKLLKEKQRGLHSNTVLLDVREKAETEMGKLPGATAIRFPDIAHANLNLAGKIAILYCDNGNRSYQTCQALAALGIDCRFMVGGLQKWLAENKPLIGTKAHSLGDFRALPPYRNKSVLLDTPDARRLVANGAVFVDVRYPGEFSAYHLPAAINLPIRPTTTEKLYARIAALPHRPIIAPCYDRRSCFYAEILGLEVTKAGYDFRGRYTVPWDYFVPVAPRPYIQQWLNDTQQSWWHKLVDIVALSLSKAVDHTGFLIAIILLAIVSRLLVLPVSLKAERDQITSRDLVPQVNEMKRRLKDDPRRLARAMRTFYRRHGLTPVRNMLGLLFLPVMSVGVAAVHAVAVERDEPILWLANSALRDPTFVLPIVFAALICIYLDSAFVRTLRHRILVWVIGMILLTATGRLLSTAADIYLIASAALLLLQRAAATDKFNATYRALRRWRLGEGIVSLDDVERLKGCGNKAYRLGRMRSQRFAVPEGVVLTTNFLEKFLTASSEWRSGELNRIWRGLGVQKLAVRSSGSAEDGNSNSFAGVFESALNIDRAGLESAVSDVLASFRTAVVAAYGAESGGANIIVQRMIEPDYSGVLFTRDPACPSHSLVELVEGTADKLVSGAIAPAMFRFGRVSSRSIGDGAPPIDLTPLIAIGEQLERVFGRPQDVEWACVGGQFYIVQSRDITRLEHGNAVDAAVQNEWSRALDRAAGAPADAVVFEQNELSEALLRPTALSLSLMESLWASGGSIDLACRKLGLGYRVEEDSLPYLLTIFGQLYVDKRQEHARAPKLNSLVTWRLNKLPGKIENEFQNEFLPAFLKEMALRDAVDFEKLPTADLLETVACIRQNYVGSTNMMASVINIAADYYLQQAKQKLNAAGLEPARYLAHSDLTEFERVILKARKGRAESAYAILLQGIGHRSSIDYELAEPRYSESPSALYRLVDEMILPAKSFFEIMKELALATQDKALLEAVGVACRFQTLKEDVKHHSLRELAALRRVILAVDLRFQLDDLIFQLTFDEIKSLGDENMVDSLRSVARERQQQAAQLGYMPPASSALTAAQIEDGSIGIKTETVGDAGKLIGIRVSGSGIVEGQACVVMEDDTTGMATIPGFKDGDVVISRMVPPAWIPYFQRAAGFVCEVGGWLSHTAIVAREFNVPLIVQAKGIRAIESGKSVRLYPNGAVEIVTAQAAEAASS